MDILALLVYAYIEFNNVFIRFVYIYEVRVITPSLLLHQYIN